MARTTRGDSSRDTSSRPTSRGTSTPNPSAARGGRTAASTNVGPATRSGSAEQERSIETRDESGRAQAREPGGDARRPAASPAFGNTNRFGMSPFAAMRRWSEDMDRLFQDFGFGGLGLGLAPRGLRAFGEQLGLGRGDRGDWAPQVEAFRRGDNIVVRADLPGLKKDDVKVEVENNTLTISGERTDEHEENRDGFYRSERSYGQFYRAIPLPEGVDANQCEATFKDGVLEVSLKAPQQRDKSARQIPVR